MDVCTDLKLLQVLESSLRKTLQLVDLAGADEVSWSFFHDPKHPYLRGPLAKRILLSLCAWMIRRDRGLPLADFSEFEALTKRLKAGRVIELFLSDDSDLFKYLNLHIQISDW